MTQIRISFLEDLLLLRGPGLLSAVERACGVVQRPGTHIRHVAAPNLAIGLSAARYGVP